MRQSKRLLGMAVPVFVGLALAVVMLWFLPGLQPAQAEAGALFVKPTGSGTSCTQATPCTLPTALGKAAGGDSLYLGAGTYTGTGDAVATIPGSVSLFGGWNGAAAGPVVRDPVAFPSLLDGQGVRRVLAVNGGLTVTLDGLTIQRGYVEGNGGGLYSSGVNLTLRAMTFLSNVVTMTTQATGAGAFVAWGNLVVENSTFRHNWAYGKESSYGGGLAISNTNSVSVTGCAFEDNDAWESSGLFLLGLGESETRFYLADSSFFGNGNGYSEGRSIGGYASAFTVGYARSRIERNTIKGNHAGNDWGAVSIVGGRCVLDRNRIAGNVAHQAAGLYLNHVAAFTVTNNVVSDNVAYGVGSNAIAVRASSGLLAHNTIVRNQVDNAVAASLGGVAVLANNIVVSHTLGVFAAAGCTVTLEGTLWGYGPWANGARWGGGGTINAGAVNVTGLPDFVDAVNADYRIGAHSAAIDAGVPTNVITDIDGGPRPSGKGPDIGADEYSGAVVRFRVNLPVLARVR